MGGERARDVVLRIFRKNDIYTIYIAGGLSSASNVVAFPFLLLPSLPVVVFFIMYFLSFISGFILAGYLRKKVFDAAQILRNKQQIV